MEIQDTTQVCDEAWIRGLTDKLSKSWETDPYSLYSAIELMVFDLSSSEKHFICPRSFDNEQRLS